MPITIPPYQDVRPQGDALIEGLQIGSQAAEENARRQQQGQQFQQQLLEQQQQQQVQNQIAQDRMKLLTTNAARQYQAQQDYQNAIQSGVDPIKAAMRYGPAMSGGRMTWHYIPQPKVDPGTMQTETDIFPGTASVAGAAGTDAVAPVPHWWGTTPGSPAQAPIPGIPGKPTRRITRRVPIVQPVPATAPANTNTNQDDPLGLFSQQ